MTAENTPVGLVRGPGEEPHEFEFIAADSQQVLKHGEYVVYDVQAEGALRTVLARITQRQPLRPYPTSFLSDPAIAPHEMARMLGYEGRQAELVELRAEVIGYYDEQLATFINPRVAPAIGSRVALASNTLLTRVLGRREQGETGATMVGSLLSRDKDAVPVVLDLRAIASTHLAIIASTGAGKSYLAGVLLEEMMRPNNRAAVIVIDPHGEYDTLIEMAGQPELQSESYRPEVRIYKPGEVTLRVGSLTLGDLRYLLPNISEKMEYVLSQAYRDVKSDSGRRHGGETDRWTTRDLIAALEQIRDNDGDNAGTVSALLWRVESTLSRSRLFHNSEQIDLRELVRPGKCAVLQLNEIDAREQQVMVAALMRRLYDARRKTLKHEATSDSATDFYLPYPVFTLMEEAHHFAPANANVVSAGILKTILSEGRKFGVGIGLISQRPGKLDPDVLSQCNTQFLLRIINPVDQSRVAESVESVGRELLRQLPSLTRGQAIISGLALNTPVLCRVRTRLTTHGGEDISAPDEWLAYFAEGAVRRRERDAAPIINPRSDDLWK